MGSPHLQPSPQLLSPLSDGDLWPFPCLSPSSSPPAKNNNPGTKEEIGSPPNPPSAARPAMGAVFVLTLVSSGRKAFDLRWNSSFLALLRCLTRTKKGPPCFGPPRFVPLGFTPVRPAPRCVLPQCILSGVQLPPVPFVQMLFLPTHFVLPPLLCVP